MTVKVQVDLQEGFHQPGRISVELPELRCSPEAQAQLETDLRALLTVFGGLALAVCEEPRQAPLNSGAFIKDLMDNLERFMRERLDRGAA